MGCGGEDVLTRVSGRGRLRRDGDRVCAATTIDNLRHRHMQLTVDQSRVRLRHVARPAETNHARKAPVPPFDEVKARFAADAAPCFLAGNEDRVASGQQTHPVVLKAARLFDGSSDTVIRNAVVVIDGKRIAAVGASASIPANAQVIDLGDATLLPGAETRLDEVAVIPSRCSRSGRRTLSSYAH